MFLRHDTFGDLYRQMNRLQNDMTLLFGRPRPAAALGNAPAVNIWDDEQTVYAEADLPGVDPKQIEVSVTDGNRLVFQAERTPLEIPNSAWHRHERGTGNFIREITLPTMVDAARVVATYQDGVLRIELPKADMAKPRKIAVKSV